MFVDWCIVQARPDGGGEKPSCDGGDGEGAPLQYWALSRAGVHILGARQVSSERS